MVLKPCIKGDWALELYLFIFEFYLLFIKIRFQIYTNVDKINFTLHSTISMPTIFSVF